MLHFCCADNIVAMVLRYLPKFSSTSPEALLVEDSIQKKRKGRKSQFLFTAQLLRKTNLAEIFSKARSGTIAHKNKKIITAVTQSNRDRQQYHNNCSAIDDLKDYFDSSP
jgi:hypothetical protein